MNKSLFFKAVLFLTVISLVFSCNFLTDKDDDDDKEMVEVAYAVPNYETTSQLSSKITVEDPKDYAEAGKIITYQNYIFINKPQEGVHVVDNSDPNAPVNLHFISIPGSLDMAIIDNHLYTDMFSALVVFDISDVTNPSLQKDFTVDDVFYYNPYVFIPEDLYTHSFVRYEEIDESKGIVTSWDIEFREEPLEEYFVSYDDDVLATPLSASEDSSSQPKQTSTAGSMTRFLPVGNYLYTINFNELVLFSISENYQPNRFARLDTRTQAETLFQLNDLLFVGSTTGMLMYDVENPSNPEYLNSVEHFRSCDPVVADESYAYVTLRGGTNCFTEMNELQIIDIQDKENLSVVSRQVLFNPHGLAIHQDYLIICDGTAGLKVVNVSDRKNPEIVNTEALPFAYDIIVDFPNAMVVGKGVLYQYDLSNLPDVELTAELRLDEN